MNHYDRLKVSQDAPAEVIRAAYRALAAKIQPERAGSALTDDAQGEMALLNAAYEVLIDPKHRQEYDATLQAPAKAMSSFAPMPSADLGDSARSGSSTHVDMNWMPPGVVSTATPLWPPSRRVMLMGGGAVAVIILATAGVSWQMMGQRQMEKAMSVEYATRPAGSKAPVDAGVEADAEAPADVAHDPVATAKAPPARRPSVAELAQMSDEELLQVLPGMVGEEEKSARSAPTAKGAGNRRGAAAGSRHPLDGKPLNLRTESQLIDPLASEAASRDQRTRR